jgi:hypothetical protein
MNLPLRLGQSIAGLGIVGLVVAGFIYLPTSNSQSTDRTNVPIVPPMVSSDPDLGTTAGEAVKQQPVRPNSTQITLKEAQVAVDLSQAQLAQARINLAKFQAKHDNAKILAAQGKVSRQAAATAKAAYKLAQLQHSSAAIGLQASQAQLIAAKAEVSKLGKANSGTEM